MRMIKDMLTITYNSEYGEVEKITFSKAFRRETTLMQADVLKDVVNFLNGAYAESVAKWTDELKAHAPRT